MTGFEVLTSGSMLQYVYDYMRTFAFVLIVVRRVYEPEGDH